MPIIQLPADILATQGVIRQTRSDVIMEKAQPLPMHDLPRHCRIKHGCNLIFRRVADVNVTRRLT